MTIENYKKHGMMPMKDIISRQQDTIDTCIGRKEYYEQLLQKTKRSHSEYKLLDDGSICFHIFMKLTRNGIVEISNHAGYFD
jgi:hypothetical protein